MIIKKIIILINLISVLGVSSLDDRVIQEKETQPKKMVTKVEAVKEEKIVEEIDDRNSVLYKDYIEERKVLLLDKVRESNPDVEMQIIDLAFKSSNNRMNIDETSIEEFFTIVALHLTVMEIETNFNNSLTGYNSTTADHGIMQLNDCAIDYIKDKLGDPTLNIYELEDNIEMGSYNLFQCYLKAKEKHPEDIIWWMYAYYNRGLWFDNYNYDYNQANTRSQIFIEKFDKYFNILYTN